MTTVQLHKILSDVSVKVTGDSLDIPSIEDYLNRWLEGVALRNAPATMERYENTVRRFLGTLGGGVKRPITTVTPRHVEEFMNARLKEGSAPKTVIVDLKTLNTAFRRAEAYGTILKNPVAAVRPPKNECSEREVFTHEEVQKMLNAAPSLDWQTLIHARLFCRGQARRLRPDAMGECPAGRRGHRLLSRRRRTRRWSCPCTTTSLNI